MNNKDNLLGVLTTIYAWRKPIIIVSALATIGTLIIALTLSNYYESSTLFYAASPDLAKPPAVGNELKYRDYYGQPEDIDRILSIANSDEVIAHLIEKFNLYEHYEIDTSHVKAPFFVRKELSGLYTISKTKYDAIELSIEDTDPQLAANMVNAARIKIEEVARRLVKQTQKEQIKQDEQNIFAKEAEMKRLDDSLVTLRKEFNIYNSYSQSEVLAELYENVESNKASQVARLEALKNSPRVSRDTIVKIQAKVKGLEKQSSSLQERLTIFNAGMSKVRFLEEVFTNSSEQLSLDKERYKQIQSTFNSTFSVIHLVEEGKKPIVKSRPKRSILILGAAFVSFLFSMIGALLLDAYKDVNWKSIFNGD